MKIQLCFQKRFSDIKERKGAKSMPSFYLLKLHNLLLYLEMMTRIINSAARESMVDWICQKRT